METTRPVPADDQTLARTRVRFLTAESIEREEVRDPILASWMRSRHGDVPADHIELPYLPEQNLDTPLIRAAEPVLARLGEQLEGQPVSLILTDPHGVVLTQRTGDPDLHRHLQGVELAPGFSYGEQFVGTNGIGTALEDGRPTHVFGHEHYAENLENLACAGVPIHDPISGKTIGAVDLTCWRKDAGQLLVALARTTAEQIRQALLGNTDVRELALFQAYLRACRRTTGILLAFNDDVVMMNDRARRLLDPADQSVLLGHATQALADGRISTTVVLPTGSKVRMNCREVPGPRGGDVAGNVVRVKLIESEDEDVASIARLPMFLPGVVGSAPLWLRSCHEVDAAYGRGEWLALAGEHGVGKSTLARCVHQRRNPVGRVHVLDVERGVEWCAQVRRELIEDPVDSLVIRHVGQLDKDTMLGLVDVLDELASAGERPWVAITLDTGDPEDLGELLAYFPRTVHIPPLRRHTEDLNELVPLLLSKLSRGAQLTCSPAAMHLLMRASWPGNVPQLFQVLKYVAQRKRSGVIQPADLPAEYRAVARRPLNRLESMERDAIVHSLEDADGNKNRAARLLGMSRATLYRKIHEYGIVTPAR
ncbi:transcriptional regulator of acetoin/glycerol metabolism [Kibdelosporangium banguiense]|uniref:Transcriptional regulator of acetoin/glycerol metabolism n=1 Tax=Kibdelosporangium banguiense TaxID=1365924 RepID=A0ABS4TL31_9PSEU|nr:GAF domain-containing protein [Kibdelosporangium banguiense]MBP2325129.1 transcriptional regulator of acetoin/glycerol metabolism [Kibdelosporangium banguiense]